MVEVRESRPGRGGQGRSPASRLHAAVMAGKVRGLPEDAARRILGDGDLARTAMRRMRERAPLTEVEHRAMGFQTREAAMRQGGASNREVREIQVARAQVNLARTSHTAALSRTHTAGTMRKPSRRTSHDSYVDSNGIRRSANGAPCSPTCSRARRSVSVLGLGRRVRLRLASRAPASSRRMRRERQRAQRGERVFLRRPAPGRARRCTAGL